MFGKNLIMSPSIVVKKNLVHALTIYKITICLNIYHAHHTLLTYCSAFIFASALFLNQCMHTQFTTPNAVMFGLIIKCIPNSDPFYRRNKYENIEMCKISTFKPLSSDC